VNTNSRPLSVACGEDVNPGMLGNQAQPDPGKCQSRNARSPVLGSGYVSRLESINCKLQADCRALYVQSRCSSCLGQSRGSSAFKGSGQKQLGISRTNKCNGELTGLVLVVRVSKA
jgi:hypothetical protein